mmetsp:Transcript_70409/g.159280  ORF Transcript_70409/g.159280 Transcript_70409/m.159280 type:complete len:313 (-) Transcript_70409:183-1121(-)
MKKTPTKGAPPPPPQFHFRPRSSFLSRPGARQRLCPLPDFEDLRRRRLRVGRVAAALLGLLQMFPRELEEPCGEGGGVPVCLGLGELGLEVARLERRQRQHLGRQPCQTGHVDAERLGGSSGGQVVEEGDSPLPLFKVAPVSGVIVSDEATHVAELNRGGDRPPLVDQRVVVRREHGPALGLVREVVNDGVGYGGAVEGGGPAPELIQDHNRLGRGVVQHRGGFGQLDEEGGLAGEDPVRGAEAREDSVHRRELGLEGGHEAAHLGHDRQQAALPKQRRLAAHVRSGKKQELGLAAAELEAVGDGLAARAQD